MGYVVRGDVSLKCLVKMAVTGRSVGRRHCKLYRSVWNCKVNIFPHIIVIIIMGTSVGFYFGVGLKFEGGRLVG